MAKIKISKDIHAKKYIDKNSKPQQKDRFGTVRENFTEGIKQILRGHNLCP